MSAAGAEWVIAPTDTYSAPVRASSGRRSRVTPPEISIFARPRLKRTASRMSSTVMLSTKMQSTPGSRAASTSVRLRVSTSIGISWSSARIRLTASAIPPASLTWLSLMRMPSSRATRWLTPPPARTACFSRTRRVGVVLRVSSTVTVPPLASTKRRVSVAIPDSRWRKFKAVRSAVNSAVAKPATVATPIARRAALAVAAVAIDRHVRIQLPKGFGRDIQASQHARGLDDDHAPGVDLGRHNRFGRHVAPPQIFGERSPDDLMIECRIQRSKTARPSPNQLL